MYILRTMEDISLNGDAYTTAEVLFKVCQRNDRRLSYAPFREGLSFLLHDGRLHLEGQRLYALWRPGRTGLHHAARSPSSEVDAGPQNQDAPAPQRSITKRLLHK